MPMSLGKPMFGYAAILVVGGALAVGIGIDSHRDYEAAREHYVEAARAETDTVMRHVQSSLRSIYENIRTLTYLPSVRKIDRHGTNLGADDRETVQQVYNNLASNVSVSEVYIVPADLDPDRIDPVTGRPEEPILMFDQLIVHAGKLAETPDPFAVSDLKSLRADAPEEVEIFEYRRLRDQFAWLREHYPDASAIESLDVPMISSPEIITCDNTQYISSGNDADRSGVLFSVPFFGPDEKLKGSVTAIILSNALRDLLPAHDFALVNAGYDYVALPGKAGQERQSANWVARALPDPGLIYSEVRRLAVNDPRSQWALWAGRPDADFFKSAEASAIRSFQYVGYGVVGLLTLVGLACWTLVLRNMSLARSASFTLERRVAERTAEIRYMASHDALTRLPNRTMLHEKLEDALARVRLGERLAVLCLDLDHFKQVNDTLGHPVGDLLLKAVTLRLLDCIREIDTIARLGGDEFVILQSGLESVEQASALAELIIARIAEPFELDGHQVVVGASIGIAVAPNDGADAELLVRNADMALYRAKSDGRGTCRFFEPGMDAQLQERRRLELDLRRALANQEFVLFYQPLVDARSEEITGFEALVRWKHPERGIVAPSEFVPLAEEIGLIVPLGEWIIRQACSDAATWPKDIRVAVNLSPAQFKSPTLAYAVVAALESSRLLASRLELEITESVLLANSEATMAVLHQLRSLGVRIAMDDFGTGYSSLSYLRSFPFDKIKIDRSFVRELGEADDCVAIVGAVAGLGASLGMTTTAEGVETAEQLRKVREQGCVEVQGYYFSRPRPQADITELLGKPCFAAA
jgi:diguanylate cyclase (GGDEF)-like protein